MFILVLLTTFITIFFGYYKWIYQYWHRKNLQFLPPSIPFGNLTSPFGRKEHLGVSMQKIYEKMKEKKWKHGGLFFITSPVYFVKDLDYVKNVLAHDFQHFTDRNLYYNEKSDPLSAHMFAIEGAKWRNLRTKLTPTFSSGKMKMMFQTIVDCEKNLQQKMSLECEKRVPINVKEILSCFTIDVIGSCAFGLDCKSFQDENSEFKIYGKKVFHPPLFRVLKITFANTFPNLARRLGVKLFPEDISAFYMNVVKDTVDYREKNNYRRQDFMQLLIDIKNNTLVQEDGHEYDGKTLTIEQLAAQCFLFFAAGFETSSTTMTFALYELAKHKEIQTKVRDEIRTVLSKYDGEITYESIQNMKYMNQVVDETLRKFPPAPFLTRKCVKDYKVPNENVTIEKGTTVIIPVLGIHHDEEIYPDPDRFDPERFNEENKRLRHQYAHLPFGEGPRMCIGMRFGLMETKVGLTSLLRKYEFSVNSKTQEPLKMQVNTLALAAEGEIWLDARKIE